jgi:hypothetical protein
VPDRPRHCLFPRMEMVSTNHWRDEEQRPCLFGLSNELFDGLKDVAKTCAGHETRRQACNSKKRRREDPVISYFR